MEVKSATKDVKVIDINNVKLSYKESVNTDADWSKVPFWLSQRLLHSMLVFWGLICLYFQNANLSIAIVCMVSDADTSADIPVPPMGNETSNIANSEKIKISTDSLHTGEFNWDKSLQGLLLSSFYWGYLIMQIPSGLLCQKYGPKRVVLMTMLPVAVLGCLSPMCARTSPYLFLAARILIGLGCGAFFPATQVLFSRWTPPSEKSFLVGVAYSGGELGSALIFPLGGLLCTSLGWDSVFYFTAGCGVIFCVVWFFFATDDPTENSWITPIEEKYIQHHINRSDTHKKADINFPTPATPWSSIMTSLPFWSILVAMTFSNYGSYMMLTQIPTYMKEVLQFDIESNGIYTMLPYLLKWLITPLAGALADLLIRRKYLSVLATRKLMTTVGMFVPAVCMVMITFVDCNGQYIAVALLCGSVGLSSFNYAGFMVNHVEISPQFAGTLFGVTNAASTVSGIAAPFIVAAITPNQTQSEWQVAFFIAAAVRVFGGLFFLIFAKTTLQIWVETPGFSTPDKVITVSMKVDKHEAK